MFDPRGTVEEHIVELLRQLCDRFLDLVEIEILLVVQLRSREQHECSVCVLLLDHGLFARASPLEDIHEGVDDAVLQSHDQVQVAEADIHVDQQDLLAQFRQRTADVCGRRCLADTAFA